jgi:hypothetical protein
MIGARSGFMRLSVLLIGLALSACGGNKIMVDRSVDFSPGARTGNFVVLPAKGQERAKDYSKYADLIATQLSAAGLTRVEDAAQARYALLFSYDGDGLSNASEDRRDWRHDNTVDDGKIERSISVTLYDMTRQQQYNELVFGGWANCRIETAGRDSVLLPAMFNAVLKDFPGDGHETYKVRVPDLK